VRPSQKILEAVSKLKTSGEGGASHFNSEARNQKNLQGFMVSKLTYPGPDFLPRMARMSTDNQTRIEPNHL
jgi:hypothetical protein